jgi:hypothetical protein
MARRFLKPRSVRLTAFLSAVFVMVLHMIDVVLLESRMRGYPIQVTLSIVVAPFIVFVTYSRVMGPVLLRVRETRRASFRHIVHLAGSNVVMFLCVLLPDALYI